MLKVVDDILGQEVMVLQAIFLQGMILFTEFWVSLNTSLSHPSFYGHVDSACCHIAVSWMHPL